MKYSLLLLVPLLVSCASIEVGNNKYKLFGQAMVTVVDNTYVSFPMAQCTETTINHFNNKGNPTKSSTYHLCNGQQLQIIETRGFSGWPFVDGIIAALAVLWPAL